MSVRNALPARSERRIDPVSAAAIPVAVGPFGYLLGYLFVVHLVGSEALAVWLSTVALTALALLGYVLRAETNA